MEDKSLIYLDNAATSWPKPEIVYKTMDSFLRLYGANPGRASHKMAVEAGRVILETRTRLARFFNAPSPDRVIFTLNATDSLNIALKGLLKPGDHVITTNLEHNSVVRPLTDMASRGIEFTRVDNDRFGWVDPEDIRKAARPRTKLIVVNHGSNVLGTIQPIREVGAVARELGIIFLVDAAQTAGHSPINLQKDNIDLLAFAGHKGVFGPPGTGVLIIREALSMTPFREGGTGSVSESPIQPDSYPHLLEAGTPNTVGIAGLGAGVKFIMDTGLEQIQRHEEELTNRLVRGLEAIPGVRVFGPPPGQARAGVVSFTIKDWEPSDVGAVLEDIYDIACRTGLHCAPWAHQVIRTLPSGTVRLSPGYFNTIEEIDQVLEGVNHLAAGYAD